MLTYHWQSRTYRLTYAVPPGQFNQRGTCNTPSEVAAEQPVVKRPPFKHRGLVAASIDGEPVVRCACDEED